MNNLSEKRNVTNLTASYAVSINDNETIFTNTGATGPIVVTLPKANPGLRYSFANMTGYGMSIIKNPADTVYGSKTLSNNTIGSFLTLIAISSNTWVIEFNQNWVKLDTGYTMMAGGYAPVAIETITKSMYAWGYNSVGEVGDGTVVSKSSPVAVVGGRSWNLLSTGSVGRFTVAVDTTNVAWAWGWNANGQLGDGTAVNKSSPVSVVGGRTFTQIATGVKHTLALDANGQAWSWGYNTHGSLGDNTAVDKSSPASVVGGKTFTAIACGYHSMAIEAGTGVVWAWGYNAKGQLGNNATANKSSPVSVLGGRSFIAIAAGWKHSIALDANGQAWGFGYNTTGQLGDTTAANKSSPVSVTGGKIFSSISIGKNHSTAIEAGTGIPWSWGDNSNGQCGTGAGGGSFTNPVSAVGGRSFISIAAGSAFTIAKDNSGVIWGWGFNTGGQLGDGTAVTRSSPVSMIRISTLKDYTTVPTAR